MQGSSHILRCFLLCKAVIPLEGRTEQAVAARPLGGLRQGSAHSLPNHGEAPAGHLAGFSTALTTPIVHIRGESEWNGEK